MQWYKSKNKLIVAHPQKKRSQGGGRKLKLGELEELITTEVVDLRLQKCKVSRQFIADRAKSLAESNGIEDFKASSH
jgi:hypothetical protein